MSQPESEFRMSVFRGPKNLHIGEDIHSVFDEVAREYVLTLHEAEAHLAEYVKGEGFREVDASAEAAPVEDVPEVPAEPAEVPAEPEQEPDAPAAE